MSDATLVRAALAGDASAFGSLYRVHVATVATVIRGNVHDREGVADVVQEVFTRALDRLSTLRDPERFRPWLLSIARHAAVDYRRNVRRSPDAASNADLDAAAAEHAAGEPTLDEVAEVRELTTLVAGCVAGLSRRDATALSLVGHLGFPPADVAIALGVTPGAAKVIVYRARNRLRQALALELLVRSRAGGCNTFETLRRGDDVVATSRHARSCAACAERMQAEIQPYENYIDADRGHGGPSPPRSC